MDLNKAMIIGRLTRDPETRTTPSGQTVTSFSVATNFTWTDPQGQKQEKAEFHNIVAWRRLAEICQQYLSKGRRVYIEGRLQTRDWTGQDGVKRYRTEIIADNMIMLDGNENKNFKGTPPSQTENFSSSTEQNTNEPVIDINEDLSSNSPADPSKNKDDEINVEEIPF